MNVSQKTFFIVVLIGVAILLILATLLLPLRKENLLPVTTSQPGQSITGSTLEQKAKTAINQQFQISAADIADLTVEAVDWPDSSLGCSRPGEFYAQVVTLGYRVKVQLKTGEPTLREFHTSEDFNQVVECATL